MRTHTLRTPGDFKDAFSGPKPSHAIRCSYCGEYFPSSASKEWLAHRKKTDNLEERLAPLIPFVGKTITIVYGPLNQDWLEIPVDVTGISFNVFNCNSRIGISFVFKQTIQVYESNFCFTDGAYDIPESTFVSQQSLEIDRLHPFDPQTGRFKNWVPEDKEHYVKNSMFRPE